MVKRMYRLTYSVQMKFDMTYFMAMSVHGFDNSKLIYQLHDRSSLDNN